MNSFIAFATEHGPTVFPLLVAGFFCCLGFRDTWKGRIGLFVLGGAAVLIAATDIMCG